LYLNIEQVRFGHRLSVAYTIDENTMAVFLPALILQPVVENAIKFALYNTTEAVCISVATSLQENLLCIQIDNPFDINTNAIRRGTGFGLKSIQRRLHLIYGMYNCLQTSHTENKFTTKIFIPHHKA
jgi:LytS/YehU family sensor histidine kinase